jgi:hypothetical protein
MSSGVITNISFIGRNKRNINEVLSLVKSSNHIIDFEVIIPMPKSLTGFILDSISYKQYYLHKHERGDSKDLLLLFSKSSENDLSEFIKNITCIRPKYVVGELMYDNEQKHGVPSWREFIKKHWGLCENGMYSSSMFDNNTISLHTQKKYPEPIIKQLSKMFPDDLIRIKYASEVPGIYVRSFYILNGEIVYTEHIKDKRYVYCEIYKKNPNIFLDIKRIETINEIISYVK